MPREAAAFFRRASTWCADQRSVSLLLSPYSEAHLFARAVLVWLVLLSLAVANGALQR